MSFSDIEELDFIVEKVDSLTNEALKEIALFKAIEIVANKKGLTLEQQVIIWYPKVWWEEFE
tara:strand:- start:2121 stop:2306 length:186 start_codon:yes stop_codon:yes gene_type:complete